MELLSKAKQQEEELQIMYEEMVQRIDEEVSIIEETNPEFAKSLRSAKTKEMNRIAYIMSNPLSEKDIYRAMQNYQSRQPQFDAKQTDLSQRDIEGITLELNTILARKGIDMQMSDDFMKKVEKELREQVKKNEENRQRDIKIKESHANVGTDVSAKTKQESLRENVKKVNVPGGNNPKNVGTDGTTKTKQESLREKVKRANVPDGYNPNAANNPNAPRQNSVKPGSLTESSSIERLVKNIQNSLEGAISKSKSTASSRSIQLTRKIEDLLRISEEAREIAGLELYTLEEVMRRLEKI